MPKLRQKTAVLLWTAETDPALAAPGDAEQLVAMGLHQRVVRLTACNDGWAEIRFGGKSFRVREARLRFVDGVTFDVGETVKAQGAHCIVRDIIWHFRDAAPNHYLERDGKRLSKRFVEGDLTKI
jgi:hypothetical protein